ncbi:MAG TPA: FAD-linked oxidase C-terminal domain-containing protein [Vicinamibacteria bacterium]|nr:FAD-linked oxidase C-terminal domain-containing protein [Vicinamibacteria bacterium]
MLEAAFLSELAALVEPEALLVDAHHVIAYECDGSTAFKAAPDAVVLPRSTEEVARVVQCCSRARVPFVARGAGTGLSGGATPSEGGVVIALTRMNRLLELDLDNRLALCQTGIVNLEISRSVAPHGLTFAPDPSSQSACTLGGNIAENSGGPHCFKYGPTTAHVVGLRVVLPDGQIVELGGPRETAGYDLVGLFVGSEGTFGIATEALVRLMPLPEAVKTLLAPFRSMVAACEAVSAIVARGIVPAALEMLDRRTIEVIEAGALAAGYPKEAEAVLLVELDGPGSGMDRMEREVQRICIECGAVSVQVARNDEERARLWLGRKSAFGAMGRLSTDLYVQDGVVPRSMLPEVLERVGEIASKHRIRVANVFHAGDGNLHPCIPYDGRDEDEKRRVLAASHEILELCVSVGGSISGEHGIGVEKADRMDLLFSPADLALMRSVRDVFNPQGLLNPGKIFPTSSGCGESSALPAVAAVPGAWI